MEGCCGILKPIKKHIDCIRDFRVWLRFKVGWFPISRIGCKIPCCQDDGKETNVPTLSFEFRVVQKRLNALFWADETAKYNYNAFGDVVSLDSTFSMNKSGSSFKQRCKRSSSDITSQLATNSDFQKHFHSIIWNSKLEPHYFKTAWDSCLDEFKISNNKGMKEMYGLQRPWIPAFFKHIPMSSFMRTTSLSEGQNWSFQNTTLPGSYLLMCMITFDGLMERQRHNQLINDLNTATTFPRFITPSPNELHASKVYTRKIFYQVQKEISDSKNTCFQMSVTSCNGVDTIIVLEKQKNRRSRQPTNPVVDDKLEEYHHDCLIKDTEYTVTHSTTDGSFKCSCMHFEHVGYLCSIEQILEQYILRHWRRDWHFSNSLVDSNSNMTAIDIFSTVDRCVSFLSHDSAKLKSYLEDLNKLKKKS
uniref:Protein FAR1-RELATED SEQUENCE n=1 Tax=Lactuca sativa TaxID=4236 RepID=A0A9R1XJK3_LACSA|nr:hypothetical protein LSAT_V11C400183240 [Lactuca sativa]